MEQLKNENKLNIELKRWYKKRSLDANAYCWVLCDSIAKELCKDGTAITKDTIYKDAILQIGTFEPFIVQDKRKYRKNKHRRIKDDGKREKGFKRT